MIRVLIVIIYKQGFYKQYIIIGSRYSYRPPFTTCGVIIGLGDTQFSSPQEVGLRLILDILGGFTGRELSRPQQNQ